MPLSSTLKPVGTSSKQPNMRRNKPKSLQGHELLPGSGGWNIPVRVRLTEDREPIRQRGTQKWPVLNRLLPHKDWT